MLLRNLQFTFLSILAFCLSCANKPEHLPPRQTFTNNLIFSDTTYEVELIYYGMGCPCPQWATQEDINLYMSQSDKIPMDSVFVTTIEEDGYQQNPFELEAWSKGDGNSDTFIFTGRLSNNKLKWQGEDGQVWENKVFQYSNCRFKE